MRVPIKDIRIGKRLRALRETVVAELTRSIGELGLQVPITVASGIAKREGGGADLVAFDLIAGHHRIAACRQLGWEEIEATVVQMDMDERLLWEIDENLCRAELTELERGEHLMRRKEVYERIYPQARHGGDRKSPEYQDAENGILKPFHIDAAERVGLGKSTIQHAIRRVKRIDEKVRERVRELPDVANSAVELDALGNLDSEKQKRAVAMVEAGTAGSIRDAKKVLDAPARPAVQPNFKTDAAEEQREYEALAKAWNRARQVVRDRFVIEFLDTPVADNTVALRVV